MMANSNTTSNQFPANLPVFKGDNNDWWCAQIKVIFIFQDVLEIVNDSVQAIADNASESQRTLFHEQRKKARKGLFLIQQCVDPNIFEKIIEEEMGKGS
ncbi:retrovirus-related pol polyprotein from transposon TNT 1-94 [Trifolium medium]|uniref:Retrovirus-related pol polyprotein from transposon TNT 1-94 n=1 Tax=Trifolium medium TaxID=97028 RepID=A0A392NBR5_9FABA|nr:retrovirus-related pol polyprotein from transposon TNT 1-94 [Trifolium medium]